MHTVPPVTMGRAVRAVIRFCSRWWVRAFWAAYALGMVIVIDRYAPALLDWLWEVL